MNLMRQRDDLKLACERKYIKPEMLGLALSAPVFQWWSDKHELSDDEWEFLCNGIMEEHTVPAQGENKETTVIWPRVTPYDCFRISYMDIPVYEQWWVTENKMACLRCDDGYSHKDVTMHSYHSNLRGEAWYRVWMWVNGVAMNISGDITEESKEYRAGKVGMFATKQELSDFASSVTRMLAFFLFDIYGAGHSVVKVSPKPDPTKSVQWRQAREHYLVLRRQKAEEIRESKGGVSEKDIIRSAHWRRAHLRRLTSGKFVNKRGLLVPVKKAWVGPTEWQGKDGKIYTLVGLRPPPLT